MASIKVRMTGVQKAVKKVRRIPAPIEREMKSLTLEAANEVMKEIKKAIRQPKHGDWVAGKGRGGGKVYRWRRSAPGEAPAVGMAKLMNMFYAKKASRKDLPGAKLGNLAPYARFLEFGTRKMAPRPFLGPALNAYKDKYLKKLMDGASRIFGNAVKG